MDLKKVFQIAISHFQEKNVISEVAFGLWIKCIEPVSLDGETAVISVPSIVQKQMLENRYGAMVEDALKEVLGYEVHLKILCQEEDTVNNLFVEPEPLHYSKEEMERNSKGGDYEYTFDTYIVGASNKFAHAACLAVAQSPAGPYNPLFIYGGSGLGKTHLLYAMENKIHEKFPNYKVLYVKGEDFTNELIEALGVKGNTENETHNFREKYRNVWKNSF